MNLKDGVDASGRPAKVSVEVGRLQEKKKRTLTEKMSQSLIMFQF